VIYKIRQNIGKTKTFSVNIDAVFEYRELPKVTAAETATYGAWGEPALFSIYLST